MPLVAKERMQGIQTVLCDEPANIHKSPELEHSSQDEPAIVLNVERAEVDIPEQAL
jgi:hypothetical protein